MSFKDSTNEKILKCYEERGIDFTLQVASKMLELENHKKNFDFTSSVHGEICESVLEAILTDYIQKHKDKTSKWFLAKGLILKDPDNPTSRYLTELDLTLFTPSIILLFECKSYSGEKVVKEKCTIYKVKSHKSFDVFSQHSKHLVALSKTLEPFISDVSLITKSFGICLFDFSKGNLLDERAIKWKKVMPVINKDNLTRYLDVITKGSPCWNMPYVRKAVNIIEEKSEGNRDKHLDYVKSIHNTKGK